MALSRRVDLDPPGGGRTVTTVLGAPLPASAALFRNAAAPPPAAFQLRPSQHVPKRHGLLPHHGAQPRAALTMAGPNFWERRDRGWRRGFPFRHMDIKRGVEGAGYRGVGNIHHPPAMSPPRMLMGLLPSQTSSWQPYQYPLE